MLSNTELNQLRETIDHLDLELLTLLSKRSEICDQIGRHKIESGTVTRDLERETVLLAEKIDHGKQLGLSTQYVKHLFELIIEHSVKKQYQMKMQSTQSENPRVAFLGDRGSYSHQALEKYFSLTGQTPTPVAYKSFRDIVKSVQDDEMDIGVLPIENTTSGSILEVYDMLQGSGIHIIGEEILPINHCLVGQSESVTSIKRVLGHPQAITQCNELIHQNPHWTIEYCASSADALEQVIKENDDSVVAIANDYAAAIYNLSVIKKNTANNRNNFTRFIFISKAADPIPLEIPCKISIVFATHQDAGALATILNIFKSNDIVLTKLQSRPIPEKPWEELFYADLEGHLESSHVQQGLRLAEPHCQFLKVLGHYPNCQLEKANSQYNARS